MTKGNLTREQAVAQVGARLVDQVERENCEPTGRLMADNDDRVEFSASVIFYDADGNDCVITAYYYPTQDELDAAGDDLGNIDNLDWVIEGFEIF